MWIRDQLHVSRIEHSAIHGDFKRENRHARGRRIGDGEGHCGSLRCARRRGCHHARGRSTATTKHEDPHSDSNTRDDSEFVFALHGTLRLNCTSMKWVRTWVSAVWQRAFHEVSCGCNCLVIPCAIVGNGGPVRQDRRVEINLGKRQSSTSRKRASSEEAEAIVASDRTYASLDDEIPRLDRAHDERDFHTEDGDQPESSPSSVRSDGSGLAPTMQDVFGPGGLLERCMIGGYEHRPAQLEMAEAVQDAFTEKQQAGGEAG